MHSNARESGAGIRIIGGDPVTNITAEAPFVVTYKVARNIDEYCTGSMITRRLVLTAATCFHHFINVISVIRMVEIVLMGIVFVD